MERGGVIVVMLKSHHCTTEEYEPKCGHECPSKSQCARPQLRCENRKDNGDRSGIDTDSKCGQFGLQRCQDHGQEKRTPLPVIDESLWGSDALYRVGECGTRDSIGASIGYRRGPSGEVFHLA